MGKVEHLSYCFCLPTEGQEYSQSSKSQEENVRFSDIDAHYEIARYFESPDRFLV